MDEQIQSGADVRSTNPLPGEPWWVKHASAWQQRIYRKSLGKEWERRLRKVEFPLYVRFGDIPEGERSSISPRAATLNRGYEMGVSTFDARLTLEGEYVLDVSPTLDLAIDFILLSSSNRPAYEVTGRLVGYGYCEEPLLRGVRIKNLIPDDVSIESSGHHATAARIALVRLGVSLHRLL